MRAMKRAHRLLALGLAALCGAAFGAWTEIEEFADGTRVFADKASARRAGDTAQLTHLVRWAEPQIEQGLLTGSPPGSLPYRSTIVRGAYDCLGKREHYLASTSYAGAMGNGAKVFDENHEASVWTTISPSSMEEKLWTIACAAP